MIYHLKAAVPTRKDDA